MTLPYGRMGYMRHRVERTLTDTAIYQAGTVVSDAGGGGTAAWVNRGTVAARVEPLLVGSPEQLVGGRISPEASWLVTVPADTPVQMDGRLVVGSRTFEVLAVRGPRSWELSRQIEVREVL